MSFNIGSQQADVINNVQGDQTIQGIQHATISSPDDARTVLREVRGSLRGLALDEQQKREVTEQLDEMDTELARSRPDTSGLGEHLGRITEILVSAGALVSAGTGLGTAITRLATWLGPFGAAALRLVPG